MQLSVVGRSTRKTTLMTEAHRRLLVKAKPDLIPRLRITPVLIQLQADLTLNNYDYDTIKSKKSDFERNECLIDILCTYADIAFYQFKEALEETSQSHLAELLEDRDEPKTQAPDAHTFHRYDAKPHQPNYKCSKVPNVSSNVTSKLL